MKLRDLFEEEKDKGIKAGPDMVIDLLKKNCGDMIQAYKHTNGFLYRGVASAKDDTTFLYSAIRSDRRPVEMGAKEHELISKAMEEFDLPSRRNALFVTATKNNAGDWGKPFIIFVEDGWKGVVFEKYKHDYSFYDFQNAANNIIRGGGGPDNPRSIGKMQEILEDAEPFEFDDATSLATVIDTGYMDILIKGKGYYALDPKRSDTSIILKYLGLGD